MQNYDNLISLIREIYNKPEGFIPLHAPVFCGNEKKYVNECIDTTFVSSVGKFVSQFEEMVAKYTGAKYAVSTVNGTAALHIALILSGVERDDEVITQPLTFIATINAISYTGAKPIFIDVDKDTMGLSPIALLHFLENKTEQKNKICYNKLTGKRIKACLPMHTFGHPCKIDEIKEICKKFNIELVEDAAESIGSYYKGIHTGRFAKIGALSFNGNKTITTGGGGIILTDDEALAKHAKHITTTAKLAHKWEFIHDEIGYNYRLTNIASALGCAQMENLPKFIESKRTIAKKYKLFFETSKIHFFDEPKDSKSNFWLNSMILKDKKERDIVLEYFNTNQIMCRPIWTLINKLAMYKSCQCEAIPNAEWFEERVVNLPSSPIM